MTAPTLVLLAAAIGYLLLMASLAHGLVTLVAILGWRQHGVARDVGVAPISVLKPLCGTEPQLYRRLRSFFMLDHPCVQLIFGASDPHDAALDTVARLQREFPAIDVTVVSGGHSPHRNPKISNLCHMLGAARHDVLIVSDSDICVGAEYGRAVSASLGDASVGIVTCLYSCTAGRGLWSRLGAQFVNHWFLPAALLEWRLGVSTPVFGATIALRRDALDAIGGFDAVADYLADDHMLGVLARRHGLRTVLSSYVVDTLASESDARALWQHELRWSRTIRVLRPMSHALSVLSLGLPVAVIGLVLTRFAVPAWGLFAAVLVLRFAVPVVVRRRVRVNGEPSRAGIWPWLVPLRDALSVAVWGASMLSRTVYWRGRRYTVRADGSLEQRAQ